MGGGTIWERLGLMDAMKKTENEWKAVLSPEQFKVLRQKGTERPFSGEYVDCQDDGTYRCVACGNPLFRSDAKFDAHCGWPSFDDVVDQGNVHVHKDFSHFMVRTEITCGVCDGHLGHVFDDGPTETGLRYCINSVALTLDPNGEESQIGGERGKLNDV